MAELATGLAIEAAKAASKLVTARVLDEITLAFGFQDQLVKLHDKFSNIQALLEDLGSAKFVEKSRFVNLWLKKFTDLAYSADELMDDYEYELLRRKIELKNNHPSFKKKCSNFFSTATNPAVFRIRMSHRVREILSKFDELHKEANNNGIQLGQLAREAVASTSVGCHVDNEALLHQNRKHAVARGSEFIGRKSDEEKLLQMILNPSGKDVDRLSTVAIVGIGGLGKTTIARRLYEHEKVDADFGKKIWICVSEDFKVDRLLNEMVEHLTSSKCDLTNTGGITKKLEEQLKGKKFFLVLDDVWEDNQDSWDSFKNALMSIGDLRGCVILITTRRSDVAEKACSFYQHNLPDLSEDEGWALLQQRVFNETRPYDSSFDNVGRRIVQKCKGVPLAIKAIGGTLQSKKPACEWESIVNSELWDPQLGDAIDILPSLMLSYSHLNNAYVKQCFAYCAIFPKDSKMEKNKLITLWLSQGFLHDEFATSDTMEMIGEKYFNTLLNYSFLEEETDKEETDIFYSKEERRALRNRIVYKMHDLVHDLAAYISKKYLLVWKVGTKLEDDVRHLIFNKISYQTFTHRLAVRKLKTISFDGAYGRINSTLGCARYLRTLSMAHTWIFEVPYIIGQLIHLRYLDLSDSVFNEIPESICKLYQLQTLRIIGCHFLEILPKGLYRLENLRHIEASSFLLASGGLRQLIYLQTLPPLELRDSEGWSIDELGPLDQVKGQMKIKGLQHVNNKETARQASLGRKDKIVTLILKWGADREVGSHQVNNDEDVLDSLEPHPNLQSLSVRRFMGVRFPSWMMAMVVQHGGHPTPLMNLTEVKLYNCSKIQQLPTLGQLPFLRILWLEGFNDVECIGEAFYTGDGTAVEQVLFGSLSKLHIISFAKLTTWMPPPPPIQAEILFRKIETLAIQDCPKLERVSCLQQFQTLKDLTLKNIGSSQPVDIIKYSTALQSLDLMDIKNMMMVPQELSKCKNLEKFSINDCEKVKCIPSGLISLKELKITKCRSLASIPGDLSSLRKFIINDCEKVKCIPTGLIYLIVLMIRNCRFLASIPGDLSSLRTLSVHDCEGLESMPKSLEECTSLEFISISSCPMIKGPTPDLGKLQKLVLLELGNSGELMTCCLQWIPNLHHLRILQIHDCFSDERDFNLTFPQSLGQLILSRFPNVKSLPQQFLPSTLQDLVLDGFNELEQLPEWIGNLSSLKALQIKNCTKLANLPSTQALSRLSRLTDLSIEGCPILRERYVKDVEPGWHQIPNILHSHII